jgi:hypothetical protein
MVITQQPENSIRLLYRIWYRDLPKVSVQKDRVYEHLVILTASHI